MKLARATAEKEQNEQWALHIEADSAKVMEGRICRGGGP